MIANLVVAAQRIGLLIDGYTGKPPTADPLAGLAAPDPSTLPTQSSSRLTISHGAFLQPGRYYGGIGISGGTITMAPGIYYMDHGGFAMSGGSLTGAGVMIYNDPSPGGSDKVHVNGGTWNLTAPTDGTYMGVVFFQARGAGNVTVQFTGQTDCELLGTVYAPSSPVQITGGSDITVGSMYISDTLTVNGQGSLFVDWKGLPQPGKRDVRLVE